MTAVAWGVLAQSNEGQGNGLVAMLPIVLMIAVFYFLLIRPQQRRARAQRELVESVDVGDEVITIGGVFGTVRSLDDDSIILEVAPGTTLRLLKSAVARKLFAEEEVEDEEADETS